MNVQNGQSFVAGKTLGDGVFLVGQDRFYFAVLKGCDESAAGFAKLGKRFFLFRADPLMRSSLRLASFSKAFSI